MPIPDRTTWRTLLRPALDVVRSLEASGYGRLRWSLGGGTVLMFRFDHRISKDIDIFTPDAQAIGFLSPRLNDVAARLADSYEEQSNALKLQRADGNIDFIVAGHILPHDAPETMTVDGESIALDSTAEILAKKLLYRADAFKARDAFDLAVALDLDPAAARAALQATAPTRPALLRRLRSMQQAQQDSLLDGVLVTHTGQRHVPGMLQRLIAALGERETPP